MIKTLLFLLFWIMLVPTIFFIVSFILYIIQDHKMDKCEHSKNGSFIFSFDDYNCTLKGKAKCLFCSAYKVKPIGTPNVS